MLKETTLEDYYELRTISNNRLHAGRIAIFFQGALGLSVIPSVIFAIALHVGIWEMTPVWQFIMTASFTLNAIQLIATVLFQFDKIIYRFQKLQSILLCMVSIKVTLDFYLVYFFMCVDMKIPEYMTILGICLMLGGFAVLVISTLRAIRRVKQGEFRQGGRKLFNFQSDEGGGRLSKQTKYISYISIGIFLLLTCYSSYSQENPELFEEWFGSHFAALNPVPILIMVTIIHYGIYMVWPEFLLLTYCKFRFEAFHDKMYSTDSAPKRKKERRKTKGFMGWFKNPIAVILCWTGWSKQWRAPFWAVLVTWAQAYTVIFVLLSILFLLTGDWEYKLVSIAGIFSSLLLIGLILVLGVLKLIHKIILKLFRRSFVK
ncbi:hypothetical protein [Cohnella lupini]|uniref:Uncharacterized protein n=1 Tax=Cohnella lupini TaxID=1294267 RepID=A0A3D9HR63_9BACL|nr:hypothetical protein [Cohnella lupini]RED51885.1 hypothetical protein DFP95_13611 [Cohnella lupini]